MQAGAFAFKNQERIRVDWKDKIEMEMETTVPHLLKHCTAPTEALRSKYFRKGDIVKNFIWKHWDIPADAAFLSGKLDKGETVI